MAITYLKHAKPDADKAQDDAQIRAVVETTLADIEARGDQAVRDLAQKFDQYTPSSFRLSEEQIHKIIAKVPARDMEDIKFAQQQVRNFAQVQRDSMLDVEVETLPGVILGHKHIAVQSVGCYVPAGKFPMVASAHMSVATASVAGVPRIIACTPPFNGEPNPAVVAAMHLGGAHEIYVIGGIQAVGAMAIGTETIEPVHLLVGPGNAFVQEAKKQLFGRIDIDMMAGPSEIAIIADSTAKASVLAADMIAQAEHDEMASSFLFSPDSDLLKEVQIELEKQLSSLPREAIARKSLDNFGALCLCDSLDQACAFSNRYAPEHLELSVGHPEELLPKITNAGAIFMGHACPEVVGDYTAGPSHTLPTCGAARFTSGITVFSFLKSSSLLRYNLEALKEDLPALTSMARAENLEGHARSAESRFQEPT